MALVGRLVDEAVLPIGVEDRQRPLPVGIGAAKFQHRLPGPRDRRRGFDGLFGKMPGGGGIRAPPRLDVKPMQAERLGVGPRGHVAERALRALPIAGKLRRLRGE